MKITALYLSLGIALFATPAVRAEDSSKDEQTLERTSSEVDKEAARPEGPKKVESRLKTEFKVDDARVQGLRDQKLGYGEISIVLALAEKRPGGITDANVAAIMAERNGPPKMGWGQIARKQGTTIGKIHGKVRNVNEAARKHEKAEGRKQEKREEKAEKAEKRREKAEKMERPEKAERPERAEKHERVEKPENPKH